jgi:hypothetical protein
MHGSITDKIPENVRSELRANATAALGAYRRATLEAAPGASLAETRDAIARVLADGANLHNKKGAARLSSRIKRVLNGRFLVIKVQSSGRRLSEAIVGFYTVEPRELHVHNLHIISRVGRSVVWEIETAGRISRHAVARLIERTDEEQVTLLDLAIAAVQTLRFAREIRKLTHFSSSVIPIPDARGRLVAICNVSDGEVITFVGAGVLRGQRADWFKRFMAFDDGIAESGSAAIRHAAAYAALLNEGAEIWEEGRAECAA